MKPLYRLYDVLELFVSGDRIKIGEYNTTKEVAQACTKYAEDCENECDFELYQWNPSIEKYALVKNWTYTTNTIKIK